MSLLTQPTHRRALGTAMMLIPLLGFLSVAYLAPLGALIATSFGGAAGFSIGTYVVELTSKSFLTILVRTISMSAVVTLFCLLLGFPVAYAIVRLPKRVAAILLVVVTIPYITSILIRTYAWIVVLNPRGIVNEALLSVGLINQPLRLVFNQTGIYIGMVQVQLPLMILPLYAVMSRIDRSLSSAAVSLGSTPAGAFWFIFAPLSAAGVSSGCALVFLSSLGFYITPALLGGAGDYMLAQGISLRVLRLNDLPSAATQSTLLLVAVLIVFIVFRSRIAGEIVQASPKARKVDRLGLLRTRTGLDGLKQFTQPMGRGLGELLTIVRKPVLGLLTVAVMVFLIAPLIVVIVLAFSDAPYLAFPPPGYSIRWFEAFFSNERWQEAAWFSIRVGGISAFGSLLIGIPAAFALVRRPMPLRISAYLLVLSVIVVPQIVVAVALYTQLARLSLLGSDVGFVLGYMLLGVPYVIVLFVAGLRRFDTGLEMAAMSLGAQPWQVQLTVTLPLLVPTVISAFLFAFVAAFDDVVYGMFFAGRDSTPLPIRMLENLRQEVSPQIAVVAVLLFAALAVTFAVQNFAFHLINRRSKATKGI